MVEIAGVPPSSSAYEAFTKFSVSGSVELRRTLEEGCLSSITQSSRLEVHPNCSSGFLFESLTKCMSVCPALLIRRLLRDLTIRFLLQGSEQASRSTYSFRLFGHLSDEEGPADHVGGDALSGLLAVGSLEVLRFLLCLS